MSVNGKLPFIHVEDANGNPYVGAILKVYEVGTTTNRAIYSDSGLTTPFSNPLAGANASNAAGNFPVFYMQPGLYKLRAETAASVLIWEWDNLDTGTSAGAGALPIASGGTGATTAAAALANLGAASTSDVTALAAQISSFTTSLQNLLASPQGRLTLTSGSAVLAVGVTAGTAVYYTPFIGNLCPIYDGSQFNPKVFGELTLTLSASHILNSLYDCFIINDAGTIRIVTGPAWSTITAGAGARGTGAGTTEIVKSLNSTYVGIWTNANAMATARNGATTYAVAANQGTYVGSIYIDGTAGQISCLTAWGSSRKWGVWNAWNRQPITMVAGDSGLGPWSAPATWRQSNGAAGNKITTFCGLAESPANASFVQKIASLVPGSSTQNVQIAIGYNSTVASTGSSIGELGFGNASAVVLTPTVIATAVSAIAPALGINNINSIEQSPAGAAASNLFGTQSFMNLTVSYDG